MIAIISLSPTVKGPHLYLSLFYFSWTEESLPHVYDECVWNHTYSWDQRGRTCREITTDSVHTGSCHCSVRRQSSCWTPQDNHPLTPHPVRDTQNKDYCLVQHISVTAYSVFVREIRASVLLSLNDWLQQSHQSQRVQLKHMYVSVLLVLYTDIQFYSLSLLVSLFATKT